MAVAPFGISAVGSVTGLTQLPCDHRGSFLLDAVFVEDQLYQFGSFGVDADLAVLHIVTQHRRAKYHATLHLSGLTPGHSGGGLTAFLLGDGTHDGQPKFGVRVLGAEAVIHENYVDAEGFQLTGISDGVQVVSGKSADFLGDDQLELAHIGIVDHTVKLRTLLGGRAGDTLVSRCQVRTKYF